MTSKITLRDATDASRAEKNAFIKTITSTSFSPLPPCASTKQITDNMNFTSTTELSSWSTLPWFPGVPDFPTGPGRPFSPFSPRGPGGPGGPTAEIPGSPFWPVRYYSSSNITVLITSMTVYTNTYSTINVDCNSVLCTPAHPGHTYNNCVLDGLWKRHFKSIRVQTRCSRLTVTNRTIMNIATNL